jgi:hypothetical protein
MAGRHAREFAALPTAERAVRAEPSRISRTSNVWSDASAFVLLNVPHGVTPDPLSGTYNAGSFGPLSPTKNTGIVCVHHDVILPPVKINILPASCAGVEAEVR